MSDYEGCRAETMTHKALVRALTTRLATRIIDAGKAHDDSKLIAPEMDFFAEHSVKLSKLEYGTPEYHKQLEEIKPAIDHHYGNNRHHPEHYPNGISGMNLVDVIEMLCDWKASSQRYFNGNILKSIDINVKRFNISEDFASVLRNTAELLEL